MCLSRHTMGGGQGGVAAIAGAVQGAAQRIHPRPPSLRTVMRAHCAAWRRLSAWTAWCGEGSSGGAAQHVSEVPAGTFSKMHRLSWWHFGTQARWHLGTVLEHSCGVPEASNIIGAVQKPALHTSTSHKAKGYPMVRKRTREVNACFWLNILECFGCGRTAGLTYMVNTSMSWTGYETWYERCVLCTDGREL